MTQMYEHFRSRRKRYFTVYRYSPSGIRDHAWWDLLGSIVGLAGVGACLWNGRWFATVVLSPVVALMLLCAWTDFRLAADAKDERLGG